MSNVSGRGMCPTMQFSKDTAFFTSVTTKKRDFQILHQKTGPRNPRKDIKYCEAIPDSIRLAVMLSYLASGDSQVFCTL